MASKLYFPLTLKKSGSECPSACSAEKHKGPLKDINLHELREEALQLLLFKAQMLTLRPGVSIFNESHHLSAILFISPFNSVSTFLTNSHTSWSTKGSMN
jgi:hypothetical protein